MNLCVAEEIIMRARKYFESSDIETWCIRICDCSPKTFLGEDLQPWSPN